MLKCLFSLMYQLYVSQKCIDYSEAVRDHPIYNQMLYIFIAFYDT